MKIILPKYQLPILSLLVISLSLGVVTLGVMQPRRPQVHASSSLAMFSAEFTLQKVFGQPNFESTAVNRIVGNRAFHIGGVHVDSQNRVYVIDSGNNRILGFRNYTGDNQTADIVIGQVSLEDSGTANGSNTIYSQPSASTLALMPYPAVISTLESPRSGQMATDSEGNLYVVDLDNNRVLKFNDPFNTDTVADDVWGQPDFASRTGHCGSGNMPTASTLCTESSNSFTSVHAAVFSSGVDIDANNNLWVADTGNNRVLRFPNGSKVADVVLGQTDMGSNSFRNRYESSLNKLIKPIAVRVKPSTGEIYVLEGEWAGENRVIVFGPNPTLGATAIREIGKAIFQDSQPDSTTNWENHAGKWVHVTTGLYWARGFVFDPTGQGDIWVNDGGNERVLLFDTAGNMTDVIGQPNFDSTGCLGLPGQGYKQKDGSRNSLCNNDGEIGIDSNNNLYISKLYFPRDVARFALPLERDASQNNIAISNGWLLHGEPGAGWNQFSGRTMENPFGMAKFENQLYVSDGQRILVWNDFETKPTFAEADFVIGQDNFYENKNNNGGIFSALNVNALTVGGGYLWASSGDRVFAFAVPITKSGKNYPVAKILYPGKYGALGNVVWADDGTKVSFNARSLAYQVSTNTLWMGDSDNYRVMRINNPVSEPVVDIVIGQPDKNSTARNAQQAGPTAQGIAEAWSLNFDQMGNLYVVDSVYEGGANRRVLRFDAAVLVPQSGNIFVFPSASGVYAKDGFTSSNYWGEGTPQTPIAVAFDSQNRMIMTVDGYGNPQYERVFVYPATHTQEATPQPVYKVGLALGQGGTGLVGNNDNQLIIQDHTWNRINFMDVSYPAIPTATPIPTATLVPTSTSTPVPPPIVNLLVNPGFEIDGNNDTYPDAWTSKPQFTRSNTKVLNGGYSGRHFSAINASYNIVSNDIVGVLGGKRYRFAHRINILPTDDSFNVKLQVRWKNSRGSILRTDTAKIYSQATNSWDYTAIEKDAPRNAVKAQIVMNMDSFKTTAFVDDFVFVRVY